MWGGETEATGADFNSISNEDLKKVWGMVEDIGGQWARQNRHRHRGHARCGLRPRRESREHRRASNPWLEEIMPPTSRGYGAPPKRDEDYDCQSDGATRFGFRPWIETTCGDIIMPDCRGVAGSRKGRKIASLA